jgi:ubiquinone/menaquinone biosynthesis C-methylase UbiE
VADIAQAALDVARSRLAERASQVEWIVGDARWLRLREPVDLWHDRAVFHFLTEPADQEEYLSALRANLAPGGHVVLATFGSQGPTRCSGLPVQRYDVAGLVERVGAGFGLLRGFERRHVTPAGAPQDFTHVVLRRCMPGT